MQSDGNAIIYPSSTPGANAIWSTGTAGQGTAPYELVMQSDGNLVIYQSNLKPTWATGTNGQGTPPYTATLGDTGILTVAGSNGPIWNSQSGSITPPLIPTTSTTTPTIVTTPTGVLSGLQSNSTTNNTLYSTQTLSVPSGFEFSWGANGQVSVKLTANNVTWWSTTPCSGANCIPPYQMVLQPSGSLVIFNGNNQQIWTSGPVSPTSKGGPYTAHFVFNTTASNFGALCVFDSTATAVWCTKLPSLLG